MDWLNEFARTFASHMPHTNQHKMIINLQNSLTRILCMVLLSTSSLLFFSSVYNVYGVVQLNLSKCITGSVRYVFFTYAFASTRKDRISSLKLANETSLCEI